MRPLRPLIRSHLFPIAIRCHWERPVPCNEGGGLNRDYHTRHKLRKLAIISNSQILNRLWLKDMSYLLLLLFWEYSPGMSENRIFWSPRVGYFNPPGIFLKLCFAWRRAFRFLSIKALARQGDNRFGSVQLSVCLHSLGWNSCLGMVWPLSLQGIHLCVCNQGAYADNRSAFIFSLGFLWASLLSLMVVPYYILHVWLFRHPKIRLVLHIPTFSLVTHNPLNHQLVHQVLHNIQTTLM